MKKYGTTVLIKSSNHNFYAGLKGVITNYQYWKPEGKKEFTMFYSIKLLDGHMITEESFTEEQLIFKQ